MTYTPPPVYNGGNNDYTQAAEPPLDQPWYGIDFISAVTRFFKKYATFSGRASRSEFWFAYLGMFIINIVLSIFALIPGVGGLFHLLNGAWSLAILVPSIAIAVRRLHDSNKSGGLVFLWYGLYLLGIIVMLLMGGAFVVALFAAGMSGASNQVDPNQLAAMGAGAAGGIFLGALIVLAGGIVWLVFMVASSNPAGARFDKPGLYYAQPQGAYPTADGQYPQAAQPGQYPQYPQYGQQTAYPAQPMPQNPYTTPSATAPTQAYPTAPAAQPWDQAQAAATQSWQQPVAPVAAPAAPATDWPQPAQPAQPVAPIEPMAPTEPAAPAQPSDPAPAATAADGENPAVPPVMPTTSAGDDSLPPATPFNQQ